jgi:hypothetical protein
MLFFLRKTIIAIDIINANNINMTSNPGEPLPLGSL